MNYFFFVALRFFLFAVLFFFVAVLLCGMIVPYSMFSIVLKYAFKSEITFCCSALNVMSSDL